MTDRWDCPIARRRLSKIVFAVTSSISRKRCPFRLCGSGGQPTPAGVEALLEGRAVTDGVRLTPYLTDAAATAQRAWIYSEIFGPNVADAEVGRTIRGPRFKRTSYADGREEMFDRLDDARERVNLLEAELDPEAETARAALDLVLDSLTEAR